MHQPLYKDINENGIYYMPWVRLHAVKDYLDMLQIAQKYDKKSGIGTIISTMIPYSVMFLIGWTILLVIWMLTGLPLGPGVFPTL